MEACRPQLMRTTLGPARQGLGDIEQVDGLDWSRYGGQILACLVPLLAIPLRSPLAKAALAGEKWTSRFLYPRAHRQQLDHEQVLAGYKVGVVLISVFVSVFMAAVFVATGLR